MVELYRCKGCGYLHVGSPPDVCPVCGAPQSFFLSYEPPAGLDGTKTLENIKAAFAGESQANRKYTLFARIAELEGVPDAVAAFEHAGAEETAHALGHLAYMGAAKSTADNLEAAAAGEEYEYTQMYPSFAEQAEQDGFADIAHYFRALAGFEKRHREKYAKVRESLDG